MSQIEHIEPLYLTTADIKLLEEKKLELGHGTDGIVFKTGQSETKDILYKIYYNHPKNYDYLYQKVYDKEGVNIADNRNFFRKTNASRFKTSYYNKDGVRIYGIDAVYKAIERQKNIINAINSLSPPFTKGLIVFPNVSSLSIISTIESFFLNSNCQINL